MYYGQAARCKQHNCPGPKKKKKKPNVATPHRARASVWPGRPSVWSKCPVEVNFPVWKQLKNAAGRLQPMILALSLAAVWSLTRMAVGLIATPWALIIARSTHVAVTETA